MTDTHTHLYFTESFPDGGGEAVERALAEGVSRMVFPAVGLDSVEQLLRLHHEFPEQTFTAVGIHPEHAGPDWRPMMEDMFARFEDEKPVAVGEVGIDLYHDPTWRIEQMDLFGHQLEKAADMNLPVIIHSRAALDDTLHVLRLMGDRVPQMVFHSFTAGPDEARRIMEAFPQAYFGINGVVTFKNAPELREAVGLIGAERIVLETDAPYLAPVPKRGRTNESSLIPYIRDKVAEVCALSPAETERLTDANATRLFRLPPPS